MGTNPTVISQIRIARRLILAAKLESGGPADPPAEIDYTQDSIEVHDVEFTPHVEEFERKLRWPTLSQRPALKGIEFGELSFTVDMFGNGAGNVPFLERFLRSSGFQQKTSNGIYYYVPRSDKGEYLTIYFNYADILYKLAGAQGDIEFSTSVGNPLQLKAKYTGKLIEVKDETLPEMAGNQILPPVFKGNPVLFPDSGKNPYTYEVSFGLGNKVIPVKASNDATGVVHAQIVERDPKATIKFQAGLIGDYDFFTAYKTGAILSAEFTVGAEDGNKIHVKMPRVQISEYKEPEEDGLVAMELGLRLVSYDGDDELEIWFE